MPDTQQPLVHPTAIVDASSLLLDNVEVGPYAIIEANVVIGGGCRIAGHAVIGRGTRMGRNNHVHHHAIIGTESQDMKFHGEETALEIGDNNVFREFVTVNRATGKGKATRIGSGCRLLAYSHVAHNTVLEDGVVLANCAEVGGEVLVERHAIIGGLVGVHQFCHIGAHAMVGACSKINLDIPPYVTADGHPARPRGLNLIGLRRFRFAPEAIAALKTAYQILYRRGVRLSEALEILTREYAGFPEVMHMVQFIQNSRRKVARPRAGFFDADEGPS
jgi:UDP-N-acetylglucosamine acyltransferase